MTHGSPYGKILRYCSCSLLYRKFTKRRRDSHSIRWVWVTSGGRIRNRCPGRKAIGVHETEPTALLYVLSLLEKSVVNLRVSTVSPRRPYWYS